MNSKTKPSLDDSTVKRLFAEAGIVNVQSIAPLGSGEFSAVFSVEANGRDYVLKVSPRGDAHCMTYERNMLAAEVFWYAKIREHTDIRVPEIYVFDDSLSRLPSAYAILEWLEGETLPHAALSPDERAEIPTRLAEMLAKIHAIPGERFGYEQCSAASSWPEALEGFLRITLADCAKKHRRSRRGERLLRLLARHRAVLEPVSPRMVNFDLWPSNVIASRTNGELQLAWIDPERSFWGDPVVDFVCLSFSHPLTSAVEAITAHNAVSTEKIEVTRDTRIRYAFGQGYLALIMETEKYFRYSPLQFGWWRNVLAANLLYRAAFRELEAK
jgi:aminoglycoside phosphotransferase (APT) family kinase protein